MQQAIDSTPRWYTWALGEIGHMGPIARERYMKLGKTGGEAGDPWCADFANAALESSGVRGTRSASSQSFRHDPNFISLSGPSLGAVTIFWRKSHSSGLGHVCFYHGERGDRVWGLGGNEGNMVQIESMPKDSDTFGLIGYWWPKSSPLPKIGKIIL